MPQLARAVTARSFSRCSPQRARHAPHPAARGCLTRYRIATVSILLAACASAEAARGVSPYLPLGRLPEIERQVERVMVLAGRPILTRPVAAVAVLDALPEACRHDAALCEQVERYLAGIMSRAGVDHASAAVRARSGADVPLFNRRGMSTDSTFEVSAAAHWQPRDHFSLNVGLVAYAGETLPVGSTLSFGNEHAQVDIGYRDHWLSPMTAGAMLLSTHAQPMPSVTVSNYTPATRLGLRYQLSLARMGHSDRIRHEDGFTSGRPLLATMHLSMQPLAGWSIGVNRVMQFGGGARGGRNFEDVLRAFFRPSRYDNIATDGLTREEELGNQAASITTRLVVPGAVPIAVYFEYAGEDTSTSSDLRLGNVALSAGLHLPRLPKGMDFVIELSEWQNGWYVHGIYRDGLRHEGNVLGHWGGDWRLPDDGVGARVAMARLGWQSGSGALLAATYRTIDNESYGAADYRRGHALELSYSRSWLGYFIGADVHFGRDVFGDSYSSAGVFVRF